jgi:hypothetical protein
MNAIPFIDPARTLDPIRADIERAIPGCLDRSS